MLGFQVAAALRPEGSVRGVRSAFVYALTVIGAVVAALALVAPASAAAAPAAALALTPTSGVAPLPVVADASASTASAAIASYSFDFGDGTPLLGPQPGARAAHTYTAGGTFTVTVTVTDSDGQSSTAKSQVIVRAGIVGNASFESGTSGWNTSGSTAGVTLARVAAGHSGAFAARLAYGGAATAECILNDAPNWVTTTASGRYIASLWVRSETPGATLKLKLREYRKADGSVAGDVSNTITLTTAWQQVSIRYQPAAPGASTLDFSADVKNVAAGACFDADDAALVFQVAPVPVLTVTPLIGTAPLTVHADASASRVTDLPIVNYIWNFNDTQSYNPSGLTDATADHTFLLGGTYTVTVVVRDSDGRSAGAQTTVTVLPGIVGNPSFENGGGAQGSSAGWNTSGSSPGVTSAFSMGGGYNSGHALELQNGATPWATCILNDAPNWVTTTASGNYTASVWLHNGSDWAQPPLTLKLREYRKDTGALVGSASWTLTTAPSSWEHEALAYRPVAPGASTLDFTVSAKNVPAGSPCFLVDDLEIAFEPQPTAALSITPPSGVAPLTVRADASASTGSDGTTIARYSFNFGDGSAPVGPQTEPTAEHTYSSDGTYTVTVVVHDTAGLSVATFRTVTVTAGIVKNSSFETGTAGWNSSGSGAGVTLARVEPGYSGFGVELANSGTTTASCILNDAPNWVTTTAAGRYTASLWVRSFTTPGTTLKLKLREYRKDTGALAGQAATAITLTNSWQQVTVDYTPLVPGASTLDYTASIDKAAAGSVCFDADNASISFQSAQAAAP